MKVYGIMEEAIQETMDAMDIKEQSFKRLSKNCIQISLRAKTSRGRYARRSYRSHHYSVSLCWHGFERFIRAMLEQGASRVHTSLGDWTSVGAFQDDLTRLANVNVGSMVHHLYLYEDSKCECIE